MRARGVNRESALPYFGAVAPMAVDSTRGDLKGKVSDARRLPMFSGCVPVAVLSIPGAGARIPDGAVFVPCGAVSIPFRAGWIPSARGSIPFAAGCIPGRAAGIPKRAGNYPICRKSHTISSGMHTGTGGMRTIWPKRNTVAGGCRTIPRGTEAGGKAGRSHAGRANRTLSQSPPLRLCAAHLGPGAVSQSHGSKSAPLVC
jgi:hypothetical protein